MLGAAKLAAVILETFDPSGRPEELVSVCQKLLVRDGRGADEAFEHAERVQSAVLNRLRVRIDAAAHSGTKVRVAINSSSEYLIQGSCFVEPSDPPDLALAKGKRRNAWNYSDAIAALSPSDFEVLCCGLLEALGARAPKVTRRSGDQGVDFYGAIPVYSDQLSGLLGGNFAHQIELRIVGQAKHYPRSGIGTPELRDLFGSVELARAKVTNPFGVGGDFELRLADPVVYLFVTSGTLSKEALKLLDASGVVGVSGEMLHTYLADRDIGVNDRGGFDADAFASWVDDVARRRAASGD